MPLIYRPRFATQARRCDVQRVGKTISGVTANVHGRLEFSNTLAFQVLGLENDLPQFLLAKNSSQFTESDERDEQHEHERRQSKNSFPGTPAVIVGTLVE